MPIDLLSANVLVKFCGAPLGAGKETRGDIYNEIKPGIVGVLEHTCCCSID